MAPDDRYLLFIDILGFRQLVQKNSADQIYEKLDACLCTHHDYERLNSAFSTIYFSDSIIFWQRVPGYRRKHFLDMCSISSTIFTSLLSQNIPLRGAVSFGQFVVKRDSADRHDVFFGNALIEAYETQEKENWLGMVVCPSAWLPYENEKPNIDSLIREGIILRRKTDDHLLVNPCRHIGVAYQAWKTTKQISFTNNQDLINEILSLQFIVTQVEGFSSKGDFTGRAAIKYFATLKFLEDILGKDCMEWAGAIFSE